MKKNEVFFEIIAFFRDFSVRFVIFNIEVNKLEIRKISPISTLFSCELFNNFYI